MRKPTAVWRQLWLGLVVGTLAGCMGGGEAAPGLPGAPGAATAQAADAEALVTWRPPTSDGGTPIMYYIVRCEPACGGAIVTSDQFQATVRGLHNGFAYTFKVSAVNIHGEGPASVQSELVTPQPGLSISNPTVPGQPRGVRATPGNGHAFVSWLAPASYGGRPLQQYRLTAQPGDVTVTVDAPAASAVIPGLVNGVPYRITVAATNAQGEGPAAVANAVQPRAGGEPTDWVTGYFVGYQLWMQPVDAVDVSGLTHLVVGRVKPNPNGTLNANFDANVDDSHGRAMAKALAARAHQHGRKALLMLGGFGEHQNFVHAASAPQRAHFIRNILQLMDELGYDGVDVDWEPIILAADIPEGAPMAPDDGEPLLALLEGLRAARPDILLTVPVDWLNSNFPMSRHRAEFMKKLAARVDQLNIMSYKMSGHWGGWESWHSSPLHGHSRFHPTSVSHSVEGYLDAGVPAGRLGVGIGFFGTCWGGVTEPHTPLDGREGVFEGQSDNFMSYTNIMTHYYRADASRWDDEAKVPYLSFPTGHGPGLCNYVSYEDPRSIAAKGQYAREKNLGGAIIWTLSQGHFLQPENGHRDPLLDAVKHAFLDP
ncbi:glycosyl hydrolase family 18 protein [Corallococcus macrosporus]|uniref:chitinase n=1 Tax=Corallococcus macrosporus DSM 14697 TaxID=1189310 RepID=A0A250JS49_9BACT|nr:glycosyl hydrolase family 18 protein [Corallococcus macrosporus]ATB46655.1 glycosyl hydrolase [Corallococcus macrosporus DSM 14697]